MNRCNRTGIKREKPYLNTEQSKELRGSVDLFIDKKIEEWNETVPYARHFEGKNVDPRYYRRHLIETAWRIRLMRVAESKAVPEIAKISPESAQIWANYQMEEMLHDELFIRDYLSTGAKLEELYATEPYLSTKLLSGFCSYLLDHESPMGIICYSYLVETVGARIDARKLKAMKESLGDDKVKGYASHFHTDTNDDHPGEVWNCLRYLIRDEDDVKSVYLYLAEIQKILAMYFNEIYQDMIATNPGVDHATAHSA